MASGLPCIVSNKPYARFIIKNGVNGILSNPKPQAIAEKINLLLSNKDLKRKIISEARKTIVELFNNNDLLKKEIKIMNDLANKKGQK